MTKNSNRSNISTLAVSPDIMQILIKMVLQYNRNRSTSIAVYNVKQFIKSINYVIDHYEPNDQMINVEMRYEKGLENLENQLTKLQTAFIKMKNDLISFNNFKYLDVMTNQFVGFFATYDLIYRAHICPYDLDYPLIDGMPLEHHMYHLNGLDLVEEYFKRLSIEHQFIRLFSKKVIDDFLETYQQQKKCPIASLGLNLCEIVVIQYMFYLLVNDGYGLSISQPDYQKIITKIDTYQTIDDLIKQCLFLLNRQLKDEKMYLYLLKVLPFFKAQLNIAINNKSFKQLIIIDQDLKAERLVFKASQLLSDNDFNDLKKQLDDTSLIESRITLIKDRNLSINDLIDLLNILFWTDDEYVIFFKSLDIMTIAILIDTLFKNELYFAKLQDILTLTDDFDYAWEGILIKTINKFDDSAQVELTMLIEQFGSFG